MPPAGVTRRRISKRLDVPSGATAENVAGGVQLAQFGDARVGLVEVVEAWYILSHPGTYGAAHGTTSG